MCIQFLLFCQPKDNFSKHSPNQIFLSLQGPLKSFSTNESKVIYKACCWDCDDFYIDELTTSKVAHIIISQETVQSGVNLAHPGLLSCT